jgi:hypothetical protein
MSLPCIIIPLVEVPHFNGNDFVSHKSQISSYLREMNPQVWWMVDIGISHTLEDCPQTQGKRNVYISKSMHLMIYLVPCAEIKDEIKIEYGWFERANLLWKVLEQMYGLSNSKKSSPNALTNI